MNSITCGKIILNSIVLVYRIHEHAVAPKIPKRFFIYIYIVRFLFKLFDDKTMRTFTLPLLIGDSSIIHSFKLQKWYTKNIEWKENNQTATYSRSSSNFFSFDEKFK